MSILKKVRYKTTIASVSGALIVFALSKGYIDGDIANLLSTILVSLGLTINTVTNKR